VYISPSSSPLPDEGSELQTFKEKLTLMRTPSEKKKVINSINMVREVKTQICQLKQEIENLKMAMSAMQEEQKQDMVKINSLQDELVRTQTMMTTNRKSTGTTPIEHH
jgi:hypothetical protein